MKILNSIFAVMNDSVFLKKLKFRLTFRHLPWIFSLSLFIGSMAYFSSSVFSNMMYAIALETEVDLSSLNCDDSKKEKYLACTKLKGAIRDLKKDKSFKQSENTVNEVRNFLKTQPVLFLLSGNSHAEDGLHHLLTYKNAIYEVVNKSIGASLDRKLDPYNESDGADSYKAYINDIYIFGFLLWLFVIFIYWAMVITDVRGMVNCRKYQADDIYDPNRKQFPKGLSGYIMFKLKENIHYKILISNDKFMGVQTDWNPWRPFGKKWKCFISNDIKESEVPRESLPFFYAGNPYVAHRAFFHSALLPLMVAFFLTIFVGLILESLF